MRAKFVNEAIKHLTSRPKEELENHIGEDVQEKITYLEKVSGKPIHYDFGKINFDSEMFGTSNFLKNYITELEKYLNSKLKKGKIKLTRDWNVGDYWIVSFENEEDEPKDKDGEYYQMGLNLEMDDWEPEQRLEACGFGIATWEGAEVVNGLDVNQFAEKMNKRNWAR